MAEIQTLDGVLQGNISTVSSISSNITTTRSIQGSLNRDNSEAEVEISKIDGEIEGQIVSTYEIVSNLSSVLTVQGKISTAPARSSYPFYDGVYEVTPLAQLDIILNTNNKILQDNVVVREIPYYETTNESGGYTVTIG